MIDAKTLHIGSHVLYNGKRERVRGLDEDNGLIIRFPAEYVLASEVEPMLITEELLQELGFEIREGIWRKIFSKDVWMYLCGGNDSLPEYDVRIHYAPCSNCSFACTSLHELEAMFYLTTKTELIKN